ncbi:MAG: DUF3696 domain-containing protein [Termitinemataceae bacterium]|nr:MAG: DUF3696 domain-containing protein [Termitinemataceae bacterium]
MITNIKIENFKPLRKIDIQTKPLNLLMGLNGMGKTSFIQMILLLMQSDKLEKGVMQLNGILADIGLGKDALYQFTHDEMIRFGIKLDGVNEFLWEFKYVSDEDELSSSRILTEKDMKYFRDNTKRFQYISTNRIGPMTIYDAAPIVVQNKRQLGIFGEFTPHFIDFWGNAFVVPEKMCHKNGVANNLLAQVNAWLKEVSPGVSINTKLIQEVSKVMLSYQFDIIGNKTNSFRPKNVGYGISYTLPVIVALLTAEKDKIIIIENPESHIHPRGQAEMGKLIALAAQNGAQLFVETHSDHILNGIRVAVKEKTIEKDNVNILFFDKMTTDSEQYAYITPIQIDKNGSLSDYPENFLDEWSNQLSKLI